MSPSIFIKQKYIRSAVSKHIHANTFIHRLTHKSSAMGLGIPVCHLTRYYTSIKVKPGSLPEEEPDE